MLAIEETNIDLNVYRVPSPTDTYQNTLQIAPSWMQRHVAANNEADIFAATAA